MELFNTLGSHVEPLTAALRQHAADVLLRPHRLRLRPHWQLPHLSAHGRALRRTARLKGFTPKDT